MNEERQAQALAQYLDNQLLGKEPTGPAETGAVDADLVALGELGRTLSGVKFQPRPAHQAAIERLLVKHRPALGSGGSGTPLGAAGTPFYGIVMLIALIVGAFTLTGARTFSDLLRREEPSPAPLSDPTRPLQELAPGAMTLPPPTPVLSLTATNALTAIPVATRVRALRDPALGMTPTVTSTVTVTPTATVTSTATVTPTVTVTPTATVTPIITVTPTVTSTPKATITPTLSISGPELNRVRLAFHPEHLNAGGVCKVTYSASGSLKNHGPDLAAGVEIAYQVVSGASWVDRVEVSPSSWRELGTSKPARFTVYVHTNEAWPSAGKGAAIVVRLRADGEPSVDGGASSGGETQATFTVRNQCKPEQHKPDKPDKPSKPDKPDESKKPKKPKKSFYEPGMDALRHGEAESNLSQGEV